jgi:hypothetical protein
MVNNRNILPEFQDYLVSRKLVKRERTGYFALWVSRFLVVNNKNKNLGLENRINLFLKNLEEQGKKEEWQLDQARNSSFLLFSNAKI